MVQAGVTDRFYPSAEAVRQALVELLAGEVRAMVEEGVPYIQVDAPGYTRFMVPERRAQLQDDPTPLGGEPPVEYDPEWTAKLFQALDADVFQVEYTGRAKDGALHALRDVPKGKVVALGMINIATRSRSRKMSCCGR